jgi:transcriptional regulator with XRE-family HTH domain
MTRATISANLRRARKDRGWTQGQTRVKTGVHQSTLSGYERGVILPNAINLAILCHAYRVSSDEILGISE